jgi:hypothetical protein
MNGSIKIDEEKLQLFIKLRMLCPSILVIPGYPLNRIFAWGESSVCL